MKAVLIILLIIMNVFFSLVNPGTSYFEGISWHILLIEGRLFKF